MAKDSIFVTKRNSKKEKFNIEKIHQMLEWATKGLSGVEISQIEINVNLNMINGISTKEIHSVLVESAADLISVEHPNYQFVASRLLNIQLRKDVWSSKNPPHLSTILQKGIKSDIYDKQIKKWYSKEEINKINEFLDHDADYSFTFAGLKQLCDKYLIQNRETKKILETPQFAYILVAMCLFKDYAKDERLLYVKRAYKYFSKHKINLPTPILAGLRTPLRSFASCMLVDCDDSMNSILATISAVGHATSRRYGIGLNLGRIRAINSSIRCGSVISTGIIPFTKIFEATVKSCQQNGIRGGSATVNFPIWHYEIEDIVQLRNEMRLEENSAKKLDYCVSISKLFYDRFIKKENITLFSPHEVKGLYDAYGTLEFDDLYIKYENDPSIKQKKTIPARELFDLLVKERVETGRIYIFNIDNVNSHSSFIDPVNMTNLCTEVVQPCTPLTSYEDPNGFIGICILAAINWLEINSDAELEKICDVTVRMLDSLIDYQEYFNPAAKNFATKRRSLGVGITNLAAFLAKKNVKYEDPKALELIDEMMEKQQFFLTKASIELAKEKGHCEMYNMTQYSKGIFPIDTYNRNVEGIVSRKLTQDWESLRKDLKQYGIRNSTLSCQMPVESSSVVQNATNGAETVRGLISYKQSKSSTIPFIVPNVENYGRWYTLSFDMSNNRGLLNVYAVLQKYMDMAISVNTYYRKPLDGQQIMKDILYHHKMGGKTMYYNNTDDGNKHEIEQPQDDTKSCESGACTL